MLASSIDLQAHGRLDLFNILIFHAVEETYRDDGGYSNVCFHAESETTNIGHQSFMCTIAGSDLTNKL